MASFEKAHAKLAGIEGLYSNNPSDPGGETVCGISRVFWPRWAGWLYIDAAKKAPNFPKTLQDCQPLMAEVYAFYRAEFWDRYCLDEFDQALAEELFEQAVNLGAGRMVKHLQQVLNSLNHIGRFGADLIADGAFGPKTLHCLRLAVGQGRARALQYGVNGLQCAYYVSLGLDARAKREFTSGWLAQRGEARSA